MSPVLWPQSNCITWVLPLNGNVFHFGFSRKIEYNQSIDILSDLISRNDNRLKSWKYRRKKRRKKTEILVWKVSIAQTWTIKCCQLRHSYVTNVSTRMHHLCIHPVQQTCLFEKNLWRWSLSLLIRINPDCCVQMI